MSKNSKNTQEKSGFITILMIMVITISIGLCYGILAVAESMIQKKEASYGVQSAANAAAFVYAREYVVQMKQCIKTEILEFPEIEQELKSRSECNVDKLQTCLESDFVHCDLDLASCIPEIDTITASCERKESVKSQAMSAAIDQSQIIAKTYHLEKLKFSESNQEFQISANKKNTSLLPKFGISDEMELVAHSKYLISKRAE